MQAMLVRRSLWAMLLSLTAVIFILARPEAMPLGGAIGACVLLTLVIAALSNVTPWGRGLVLFVMVAILSLHQFGPMVLKPTAPVWTLSYFITPIQWLTLYVLGALFEKSWLSDEEAELLRGTDGALFMFPWMASLFAAGALMYNEMPVWMWGGAIIIAHVFQLAVALAVQPKPDAGQPETGLTEPAAEQEAEEPEEVATEAGEQPAGTSATVTSLADAKVAA
jgi:hypothetical protein